jgi:AraC-like DNA-binding protein
VRGCLQALLDDGWSIPQLATHLDTTQPAIRRAITVHQIHQPPRRQQLARQRQRAAQQRATARIAELGFAGMRAYLVDRLVTRAWTLAEVASELGAAPSTLRRLLDQHEVRRVAPTRRQHSTPQQQSGPQKQARSVQQRRQARLAELGFAALEEYLRDRYVGRGWSVRRLCDELGRGMAGCSSSWPGLDGDSQHSGRRGSIQGGWRPRRRELSESVSLSTITHLRKLDTTTVQPGGRAPLTPHVGTRPQ